MRDIPPQRMNNQAAVESETLDSIFFLFFYTDRQTSFTSNRWRPIISQLAADSTACTLQYNGGRAGLLLGFRQGFRSHLSQKYKALGI